MTNGFWYDMVNQNKIFSFQIKGQANNVFPSDVERTTAYTFMQIENTGKISIFRN